MRVLVVEDEGGLAAALRGGLEAEGFAVDVAADGVEGLWLARENPYDVLVLDVMLPGLSGYQLCATLRKEENWTPILILTAKDGEWDEVDGLDIGADDYLTKPFSYAVLLARLRALLRRGARPRPAELEAGDLRLDPAARRVWRAGAEVRLTAREHALLEFLLRRAGRGADADGAPSHRRRGSPRPARSRSSPARAWPAAAARTPRRCSGRPRS